MTDKKEMVMNALSGYRDLLKAKEKLEKYSPNSIFNVDEIMFNTLNAIFVGCQQQYGKTNLDAETIPRTAHIGDINAR